CRFSDHAASATDAVGFRNRLPLPQRNFGRTLRRSKPVQKVEDCIALASVGLAEGGEAAAEAGTVGARSAFDGRDLLLEGGLIDDALAIRSEQLFELEILIHLD